MKQDGFLNERIYIIPKKIYNKITDTQITDLGFFPNAIDHYKARPRGTHEHIMIFCIAGKGYIENKTVYTIEPGDVAIIPMDTPHIYRTSKNHPWDIYWVHFISNLNFEFSKMEIKHYQEKNINHFIEIFQNMLTFLGNGLNEENLNFTTMALNYLLTIIITPQHKIPPHPIITKAAHYLKENIHTALSMKDLCKYCCTSPTSLFRYFKDYYNKSPVEYIHYYKMNLAVNYLSVTKMSIKTIALTLGFSDPYYFSKFFKKHYKVSPKKYRDSLEKTISRS